LDAAWTVATLANPAVIHFFRAIFLQFFSSSVDDANDEVEDELLDDPRRRRDLPEVDFARTRDLGGGEPSESE
jgi:hypothetical protein